MLGVIEIIRYYIIYILLYTVTQADISDVRPGGPNPR